MKSIAKTEPKRKRVKIIRGGLGFVIEGQHERWHGVALPKRKRGDITKFSASSKRRMRETLARAKPRAESAVFGITLTLPGKELPPRVVREIWGAFVDSFRCRRGVALVWRVELQTRKDRRQAHWHCIVWIPKNGGLPPSAELVEIIEGYKRIVLDRVGVLEAKTLWGFEHNRGFDIRSLEGASATGILGYLCDHATKHKREQLGWRGRQWGVVNRRALDFDGVVVAELDESQHVRAARQFRRLQEHLRAEGGRYTGGSVAPSGNVMRSIFGNDAERWRRCFEQELKQKGGEA